MASRRRFLQAATALASFPPAIQRALAIEPHNATGTLTDVEHVVILMQENRSFDHYFGALNGVRGFNDPQAITLPSGLPVWHQPGAGGGPVLPYHFDAKNTNALRVGLDHSWKGSEAIWKDWNAWVPKKSAACMGYFTRADLPFYYALADAFTVCDAYHCSVFGATDPNRFYALTGHAGGHLDAIPDERLYNIAENGLYNADIANDKPATKGLDWLTYAEQLEAAGVSWKVYQEWDNYGDNYLQYFRNFRVDAAGKPLTPASSLYRKGRAMVPGSTAANAPGTTGQWLIDAFAADVKKGALPQISWICAPAEYCEHPEATPNAGEHFTARMLAALVDAPEVWAKTVFILCYDENDGFFDHMPPPIPQRSTLAHAAQGEVYKGEPIGLGPRVPMLVISPWSRGGRVCSQLFDHTSLLRFLEEWLVQGKGLAREAVTCPNISPWRRAVCGDLTATLNLKTADAAWPGTVPRTARYAKDWGRLSADPPAKQSLPRQETARGPRPACTLPYRSVVEDARPAAGQFALSFHNEGSVAATFIVYSSLRRDGPWHYTVESGKRLSDEVWHGADGYELRVYSHNGWLREFRGGPHAQAARVEPSLRESPATRSVKLSIHNAGDSPRRVMLRDMAYGAAPRNVDVPAGSSRSVEIDVAHSLGWYDLGVTVEGDAGYLRRLAGHLEGAGLDFADPQLGAGGAGT